VAAPGTDIVAANSFGEGDSHKVSITGDAVTVDWLEAEPQLTSTDKRHHPAHISPLCWQPSVGKWCRLQHPGRQACIDEAAMIHARGLSQKIKENGGASG
jgi:hypothetical protein